MLFNFFHGATAGDAPPPVPDAPAGGGGIDSGEGIRRARVPFKPTGLSNRPQRRGKEEHQQDVLDRRVEESARAASEIAAKLAREFTDENAALDTSRTAALDAERLSQLTQAQIDEGVSLLLAKKRRTEDEELLFLILMAASA